MGVVGVFVLVLCAVAVGALLWLAAGGAVQKKYELYAAIEDESVAGLNLNAPVKYSGVDVGRVRAISLDPANPERVNLLLAIERGTPIREGTVAVLKIQGLTGIAYVELSGGASDGPPLKARPGEPYPVIRTKPSLSARLENVLTTVLAKLDSTSNHINAILSDENQAAFRNLLADTALVARTVAARRATIDAGITDAAGTFRNASIAAARAGPAIERVGRGAEAVDAMGRSITRAGDSATAAIDSADRDLKRFSAETLPGLERMLGELGALSVSLRRLTEQTERDPRAFLFGRTPVPEGPGETGTVAPP
jgi:phospholipid/cholesterol/gamma-HCH transport system substrate-binding protein